MSAPHNKTPKPKPKAKPRTDWDAVERDYRTGKFTLRELEAKHDVSYAQISRKAKQLCWEKDLREAIKQATDSALLHDAVTDAQKNTTEVVLVAAEMNKQVILGHRAGLARITGIKTLLLSQIEQAAANMPELSEIIEMVRNPDENGRDRANDLLRAAMERGALVDDLKKLAEVDERVRKGEREAFSLNEPKPEGDAPGAAGQTMTDAERAVRLSRLVSGNPAALAALLTMRAKAPPA